PPPYLHSFPTRRSSDLIGFLAALYLGLDKLYKVYIVEQKARLITDNPWFYISLVAMVLGTQLFLAGFLGEILVRSRKNEKEFERSEEHTSELQSRENLV